MTQKERQKFNNLILEIGNLISIVDPGSQTHPSCSKNLDDITIEDMIDLAVFLRIYIKYNLLDVEACRRENRSLLEIINNPGGQGIS